MFGVLFCITNCVFLLFSNLDHLNEMPESSVFAFIPGFNHLKFRDAHNSEQDCLVFVGIAFSTNNFHIISVVTVITVNCC